MYHGNKNKKITGKKCKNVYLMWFRSRFNVRVTSAAALLNSFSRYSSLQLSLQIATRPSTARVTSRTACINCCWQAELWRVGATTYKIYSSVNELSYCKRIINANKQQNYTNWNLNRKEIFFQTELSYSYNG